MTLEFDMVVRGGSIADGSGGELFEGDVAIRDGVIAAIGQGLGAGVEEIDARGLLVTPGFVDVHTHYDGQLTWSERLTPSSNHGVTTVVTGNCGVGFAPCRPEQRDDLADGRGGGYSRGGDDRRAALGLAQFSRFSRCGGAPAT